MWLCTKPLAVKGGPAYGFDSLQAFSSPRRGHAGEAADDVGLSFGSYNIPHKAKDQDREAFLRLSNAAQESSQEETFAFGLFDGHGTSADVSELAAVVLLPYVDKAASSQTLQALTVPPGRNLRASSRLPRHADSSPSSAMDLKSIEEIASLPLSTMDSNDSFILSLDEQDLNRHGAAGAQAAAARDARAGALLRGFAQLSADVREFDDTRVGSTATVVLLTRRGSEASAPPAAADTWDVTCAWVGDTRAVLVGPGGLLTEALTEDHRLQLPREQARVDAVAALENAKKNTDHSYKVNTKSAHLSKRFVCVCVNYLTK